MMLVTGVNKLLTDEAGLDVGVDDDEDDVEVDAEVDTILFSPPKTTLAKSSGLSTKGDTMTCL